MNPRTQAADYKILGTSPGVEQIQPASTYPNPRGYCINLVDRMASRVLTIFQMYFFPRPSAIHRRAQVTIERPCTGPLRCP